MSVVIDIAEGMTRAINAGTFSVQFVAERSYADWAETLENDDLRIDVVPFNMVPTRSSRQLIDYQCEVDILIRKRLGLVSQGPWSGRVNIGELDQLMDLEEELYEFFQYSQPSSDFTGREITTVPDAFFSSAKVMAAYVRPHLRLHRQFTGWLRIEYTLSKACG